MSLFKAESRSPISVIMPVHNGGDFLRPAADSILTQQGVELELLIIDDRSTDAALNTLPEDERIRIIKADQGGLVGALNTGLHAAKFDLIARMDADDIAAPQRLLLQRQYMQDHPEVSICGCKVKMFADGDVAAGYRHYEAWINSLVSNEQIRRQFFVESPIAHPSAMFYRDQIIALGGYRDGDWPEDYELWCRAFLAGLKFGKPSQEELLYWRDYPLRTSRSDARYRKQAFINCKANALSQWLKSKGVHSVILWGAGPTGAAMHDALEQNNLCVDGFFDVNPKLRGGTKRDKPVRVFDDQALLNPLNVTNNDLKPESLLSDHQHLVVCVAARGVGEQLRDALTRLGWQEQRHFTLAA